MQLRRILPILLSAIALAAFVPATASAADFSLFASYYDTDDYDEAAGVGARVAFFDTVQLEIGASYYEEFGRDIDFDFDDPDIVFDDTLLELDVIPVDIGARFNFGSTYVAAGGTYFILDGPDGGTVDDEFGLYARFGLQFSNFFVEAGYRDVDGTIENLDLDDLDDIEFNDDFAQFDLTGFFVNLGWRF